MTSSTPTKSRLGCSVSMCSHITGVPPVVIERSDQSVRFQRFRATSCSRHGRDGRDTGEGRSRGFTLVEMLVVIGIIILLVGILLPALNLAYSHSVKVRMRGDIQTITTALEQYRTDMRTYPQLDYSDYSVTSGRPGIMDNAYPASVLLCWALVAPGNAAQDGAVGPGFTAVPNGQVYGPYIEASRFKMAPDPSGTVSAEPNLFLQDRYGHPILYFKAFPGGSPTPPASTPTACSYVDWWMPKTSGTQPPQPMYNLWDDQGTKDNPALCWSGESSSSTSGATSATASNALVRMRLMLGDKDCNGLINGNEQAVTISPYLLWSAGPDEVFGLSLTNNATTPMTVAQGLASGTWASQVPSCDDATNFRQ